MIIISELGDKTFLIAALMAMSHPRGVVFAAAFGALLVMSVLSAALGHAVPHLSISPIPFKLSPPFRSLLPFEIARLHVLRVLLLGALIVQYPENTPPS